MYIYLIKYAITILVISCYQLFLKFRIYYLSVPEHFLSRKDLSYLDKLIYIRIVGFCRNDKYNNTCFASNGYFANLFGVKPKAISVTIRKLKDLDLINVKYIRNKNLVKQEVLL